MNILVTGGTGTLGRPTVELLRAASHDVRILSRKAGHSRVLGDLDTVPYAYYRAKLGSEKVIEESGIPFTILRATQFHEFIELLLHLQRRLPVIFSLDIPDQSIAAEEVAGRLAELVETGPGGRVPDIGGPEQLRLRDAIDTWQKATDTHKPVWTLPLRAKFIRAMQAGQHMTALPGYGKQTFAEFAASAART